MKKITYLTIILLFVSCSHNPLSQRGETQLRSIVADLQTELQMSKEEIARLNGKIEEVEHFSNKKIDKYKEENKSEYLVLLERVKLLESFRDTQNVLNKKIIEAVEQNNNLIVSIDQEFEGFRKNKLNVDYKNKFKEGTEAYSKKEYKKAIDIYSYFLENPHLLTSNEYRVTLYRVALSEYRLGQNNNSIAHFSQLYQKFHREDDKYMASSLFHIASLLLKERKCLEARKVLDQVRLEYKKHKYFYDLSKTKLKELRTTCSPLS